MGRIKSALELALERTLDVQGDKTVLEQHEARQRGQKLAGRFLEDPALDLAAEIKKECGKEPEAAQEAFRGGVLESLLAQVTLPTTLEGLNRLETVGRGLGCVVKDRAFAALYKQFLQMMQRYPEEVSQYDEAIRRQYAPQLREKEEKLAAQTGFAVKLDPFQDPQFVAFYNQNMNALRANYDGVIAQVREKAQALS